MRIVELRNLPAPAKLNLFLHVTGRRPDGYHLLETVFELIDLADAVHLRLREDGRIDRADPIPGVAPDADLAVRAARLLAAESGCRLGAEISIDKRIPMGGGLGGGSSDAATTLLGLNRLWELDWTRERLAALALGLGADVPVFVHGCTSYATGVGEVLTPLPLPERAYVVVAPSVSVPTASVFAAPELTRDTKPLRISGLSRGEEVFRGRNDLQSVVVSRQPAVAEALQTLREAAREAGLEDRTARMTGSGACVFLPLRSQPDAEIVRERLSGRIDAAVFVSRSMAIHPLRDWAFRSTVVRRPEPGAD
jgi:4-diphosphocytidyl-2-C-methyl-D-erythritol kinase